MNRVPGICRVWLRATTVAAVLLLAAPLVAGAQPAGIVHRVGYLLAGSPPNPYGPVFEQALRERGWVAGNNLVITYRYAEGKYDRLPDLAAELVRLEPQVIVTSAARTLGVELQIVAARGPEQFEGAFRAMTQARAQAILIQLDPSFSSHLSRLADLAVRHRLPTMSGAGYANAGGLMAYSVSRVDTVRRAAGYVDRVLRGANPAELPVEQPTKFELDINRKTAKALGLTIPPSPLLQADQVIE